MVKLNKYHIIFGLMMIGMGIGIVNEWEHLGSFMLWGSIGPALLSGIHKDGGK